MIDRSYNAIPSKRNGRTDDIAFAVSHNLKMYKQRVRRQRRQRAILIASVALAIAAMTVGYLASIGMLS